jgi:hypothetical protein
MPWKETSPVNERVKVVAAVLGAEETLVDRSKAPHSQPHAVACRRHCPSSSTQDTSKPRAITDNAFQAVADRWFRSS